MPKRQLTEALDTGCHAVSLCYCCDNWDWVLYCCRLAEVCWNIKHKQSSCFDEWATTHQHVEV